MQSHRMSGVQSPNPRKHHPKGSIPPAPGKRHSQPTLAQNLRSSLVCPHPPPHPHKTAVILSEGRTATGVEGPARNPHHHSRSNLLASKSVPLLLEPARPTPAFDDRQSCHPTRRVPPLQTIFFRKPAKIALSRAKIAQNPPNHNPTNYFPKKFRWQMSYGSAGILEVVSKRWKARPLRAGLPHLAHESQVW